MNYVDPKYAEMILPQRTAQQQYIINYFNQFGTALNGANFTSPTHGLRRLHRRRFMDRFPDEWRHHAQRRFDLPEQLPLQAAQRKSFFWSRVGLRPLARLDGWPRLRAARLELWHVRRLLWEHVVGPLFTDPNFWQRWIDRYQDFRRDIFSNSNVFQIIDTFANELRQEQPREEARWGVHPRSGVTNACGFTYHFGAGSYQGEANWLKVWFSNRFDFIDRELKHPRSSIALRG